MRCDDTKPVVRIGNKTLSVQEFEERAKDLKKTGYNRVTEFDAEGKRRYLTELSHVNCW